MEKRFQNIDWHPALEDMIDNVFINDERMERESAMYRIMNNNFTNPLQDIENEYADVNIELIKKYLREDGEICTDTEDKDNSHKQEQRKPYVPGIKKLPFNFPRQSHLTKAQQAMCLRVLLKLSNNEKKRMNETERKELEEYMGLQEIISKEQKEFLEFAKMKWNDSSNWLINYNKFITLKWEAKKQRFEKLPVFYVESLNIPLSVQEINFKTKDKVSNIKVTFTSCLWQGTFSKVVLPELNQPYMLRLNHQTLLKKYTPLIVLDKETQHFRLPVSEDTYCESLAKENAADFVISSSGLKCLLSNLDPNYSNSWIIPVVVKSYDEKNIIYIDKRLPPTIATIPQKNTWVYKYILRRFFVKSSEKTKYTKEDELEKAGNLSDLDSSFNDRFKIYDDLYSFTSDVDESGKSDLASGKTVKINNEQNVSYNLFTIGPTESTEHERIRHGVKEYQMLVRTKTDGIELSNGESQSLILAPKMEHQLGFGAEAITLEEGLHQWASLKFRPKTSLARVRIAADTTEVIQIERHTTMSLNNEIQRLYNVKAEDSLNILHSIIEKLSSLTPGQYIMQYTPQNGPFAYVYKQADSGKNLFNLRMIYQSMIFDTIPKTPWPPIDNMMTTPAMRYFHQMPAMFRPSLMKQKFLSGRPRGRPKKNNVTNNADVTNDEVPVSPRRSVRLRKTNCS